MNMYQYVGAIVVARTSGVSFGAIMSGEFTSYQTDLVIALAAVVIGIPLVFLVTKFLWRRSFEWMRLRFDFKYLLYGLSLGLLLPFAVILVLKLLGCAELGWSPNPLQSKEAIAVFIGYACMAMFTGIAEEVVFRGMAVREIAIRYGWIVAAIIGGVYFGAAHVIGKLGSITIGDALWIIVAGVAVSFLFVALYIRSQSLWLPVGFHVAWNFCLKGIMGITMSGKEAEAGLFEVELTGNEFVTGGSFGMEASVVSVVTYLLMAILVIRLPWRGRVAILDTK
ncbi:MAG: CPBP family intramembrane metalloprotease [candidate division Zixibacteria bacterium]|nr:CPBP family intramembrane metalloprotease [candidate division Zixibacteria bacterium]